MAVFNAAKREIDLKIVYYGPAMCGKTTNVQCIHKMLAPQQRGELMSLATKDDRTLFFDFLPIELGDVRGFKTRFHIYTVPGQVYYGLTRRAVLTGADGVVFVVDSQTNKLQDNIESLKDLAENLKFYKKEIKSFPFVLQYNKRDLPHVEPFAELNAMLNTFDVPAFESSALTGMGVVETLTAICKMVLKQMDSGTAKKKPTQPSASGQPVPKTAAPSGVAADDAGLQIFSKQATPPSVAGKPEPVQPTQIPPAPPVPAAMPAQKPSPRLRPTEPAPLSFDEPMPPAAQTFQRNAAPQFEGIGAESPPAFENGSSDMSADIGLSFDDNEEVALDVAAVPEPDLSFDAEEEVSLDEEAMPEPELSFDDDAQDLVMEEPAFEMEEPELSFEDDDSGLAAETASDAAEQTAFTDDSSAFTLEEPSLQFEEPQGGEDFSEMPVLTPSVAGFSIVACGEPRKISDTSISLPITLRLNKDDTECPITITISLDDMPFR